jgi:8-oxo-dGTP pyrophosphatase MutT (NUDIX family)
MENKQDLLELIKSYQQQFPLEHSQVKPIASFVEKYEGTELYSRNNFDGHITVSAFILDATSQHLLLLHHKTLDRWLQPGGHVDTSDPSLIEGALREVEEETGLLVNNLQLIELAASSVFDIDTHRIPENLKKQEPAHWHHDVRFLFSCSPNNFELAAEAGTALQWVPLETFTSDETFGNVVAKIKKHVLNRA